MILITVFLGVIAASEVVGVILNTTNKHLAEQLRTVEKAASQHAENAVTTHKQMVEQGIYHRREMDAMTAKIIELTKALEEAKKDLPKEE